MKNILYKKVTGSLFRGSTWEHFICLIYEYFLQNHYKPIFLLNDSPIFADNINKFYGKHDLKQLLNDLNTYKYCHFYISIKIRSRCFKTKVPMELRGYLIKQLDAFITSTHE